jgi:hypothetical protein
MAQQLSLIILCLAGLWLTGIGILMLVRPERCLGILRQTASTRSINNREQGLRLLAGLALILRAPVSKLPGLFELAGWFIALSSLALLVLPLRLHAGYAIFWADHVPPSVVRAIGPLSVAAGAGLIYAAL